MATSLQALREKLSRRMALGEYREGTTTSAGAADGTTLIDSGLADKPDDFYNGAFVKTTSGSTLQVRAISDFASATGTVTVAKAFSAQIATSVTYELHKAIDPDDKDIIIKEALRLVYPHLHKVYFDDSLVTGDWGWNTDFEEWTVSTTPDKWLGSNTTLAEETTIVRHGASSLKHTATAANSYVEQSQTQVPRFLDLAGRHVHLRGWYYTATASHARPALVTVDDAGTSTTTTGTYHDGDSRWDIFDVEADMPRDLRSISCRLQGNVDTGVAYWDRCRIYGGEVRELYLPISGWQEIRLVDVGGKAGTFEDYREACDDRGNNVPLSPVVDWAIIDDGTNKLLRLPYFPGGYKVVLRGFSYLTQPASDTATTEIDEPQTDYLVAVAASMLFDRPAPGGLTPDHRAQWLQMAGYWRAQAENLKRSHAMSVPTRWKNRMW